MTRVAIFIDGSNLYHSMKEYRQRAGNPKYNINYQQLVGVLLKGRDLVRPYYYNSIDMENPDPGQSALYDDLRRFHFELKICPLRKRPRPGGGNPITFEKGVDVNLASDMVGLCLKRSYDVAVLVSGDSDYREAIKYVKGEGVRVEVAAYKENIRREIIDLCDDYIELGSIAGTIARNITK